MPSKKRSRRQSSSRRSSELSALRTLKRKGLYSGSTDRVSSYARKQIRKYADVLQGRASVVKAPSKKAASRFDFHKGSRIIVPKFPGERFTYNKRTGDITASRVFNNKRITRHVHPRGVKPPDDSERYRILIPFGRPGEYLRFPSMAAAQSYMQAQEEGSPEWNFDDWEDYVEYEEIEDYDDDE